MVFIIRLLSCAVGRKESFYKINLVVRGQLQILTLASLSPRNVKASRCVFLGVWIARLPLCSRCSAPLRRDISFASPWTKTCNIIPFKHYKYS